MVSSPRARFDLRQRFIAERLAPEQPTPRPTTETPLESPLQAGEVAPPVFSTPDPRELKNAEDALRIAREKYNSQRDKLVDGKNIKEEKLNDQIQRAKRDGDTATVEQLKQERERLKQTPLEDQSPRLRDLRTNLETAEARVATLQGTTATDIRERDAAQPRPSTRVTKTQERRELQAEATRQSQESGQPVTTAQVRAAERADAATAQREAAVSQRERFEQAKRASTLPRTPEGISVGGKGEQVIAVTGPASTTTRSFLTAIRESGNTAPVPQKRPGALLNKFVSVKPLIREQPPLSDGSRSSRSIVSGSLSSVLVRSTVAQVQERARATNERRISDLTTTISSGQQRRERAAERAQNIERFVDRALLAGEVASPFTSPKRRAAATESLVRGTDFPSSFARKTAVKTGELLLGTAVSAGTGVSQLFEQEFLGRKALRLGIDKPLQIPGGVAKISSTGIRTAAVQALRDVEKEPFSFLPGGTKITPTGAATIITAVAAPLPGSLRVARAKAAARAVEGKTLTPTEGSTLADIVLTGRRVIGETTGIRRQAFPRQGVRVTETLRQRKLGELEQVSSKDFELIDTIKVSAEAQGRRTRSPPPSRDPALTRPAQVTEPLPLEAEFLTTPEALQRNLPPAVIDKGIQFPLIRRRVEPLTKESPFGLTVRQRSVALKQEATLKTSQRVVDDIVIEKTFEGFFRGREPPTPEVIRLSSSQPEITFVPKRLRGGKERTPELEEVSPFSEAQGDFFLVDKTSGRFALREQTPFRRFPRGLRGIPGREVFTTGTLPDALVTFTRLPRELVQHFLFRNAVPSLGKGTQRIKQLFEVESAKPSPSVRFRTTAPVEVTSPSSAGQESLLLQEPQLETPTQASIARTEVESVTQEVAVSKSIQDALQGSQTTGTLAKGTRAQRGLQEALQKQQQSFKEIPVANEKFFFGTTGKNDLAFFQKQGTSSRTRFRTGTADIADLSFSPVQQTATLSGQLTGQLTSQTTQESRTRQLQTLDQLGRRPTERVRIRKREPRPRFPKLDFDRDEDEDEVLGFRAFVKRAGKKVFLTGALSREQALFAGAQEARGTAVRTFGIEQAGRIRKQGFQPSRFELNLALREFRQPRSRTGFTRRLDTGVDEDDTLFIERTQFAINTPGELREITRKGIRARAIQGRLGRMAS